MGLSLTEAAQVATLFKDLVLAGAAIVTAIIAVVTAAVAVHGITKWRQELRGKADFEVARAVAKATYKTRDALFRSRSRMIWAWEFPKDYDPDKSTAAQEASAQSHVYENRFKPIEEALQELEVQLLEAEAIWGSQIREKGQKLQQCYFEVKTGAQGIIDDAAAGGWHLKNHPEAARAERAIVHGDPQNRNNLMTAKIYDAVAGIEVVLQRHLPRSRH